MVIENNAVAISNFSVDYHIFKRSRKKPFGEFNEFKALGSIVIKCYRK